MRKRIVAWQYPPQFQLVEEVLAQEFGVSRSPIRQALTYLAAEGLLERLPRRGFLCAAVAIARRRGSLRIPFPALESQVVRALANKSLDEDVLFRLQAIWQDPKRSGGAFSERIGRSG